MDAGKTCLLHLQPQVCIQCTNILAYTNVFQFLKVIKSNSDLKPFVVYFRTPDIEHMRNTWKSQLRITVSSLTCKRKKFITNLQEQEMGRLVEEGRNMELKYSHLFDDLIIFTNHNTAYRNLLTTSQRLREEYQWVPASWFR